MTKIEKVNFLADWAAEHPETFTRFLMGSRTDAEQYAKAKDVVAILKEAQDFLDNGMFEYNPEPAGDGFYQFTMDGETYKFDGSQDHPKMIRL